MPKGAGRVSPVSPLSPLVTDAQRYAVPQSTCDSASVIMRKLSPVARRAIQPKIPATSVVPINAIGAEIMWPAPIFRYSQADV
jgi:hypothetical protein